SSATVTGLDGGPFSVLTFFAELEQALIVYGTQGETSTNREAAEELQRAILERGPNITVPLKSDREATEGDLKDRHVLLIGRAERGGDPADGAATGPWRDVGGGGRLPARRGGEGPGRAGEGRGENRDRGALRSPPRTTGIPCRLAGSRRRPPVPRSPAAPR